MQEVESITSTLPPYTTAPADMKSSVDAISKLESYQPGSQSLLKPLSSVLDLFPQILVSSLDWKTSADEPVESNTRADVPAHVITFKGKLIGFDASYRAALTYLDRFQLELGKRGYKVEILSQPLDISPTGSLANQGDARENALEFSLKLVWRPLL